MFDDADWLIWLIRIALMLLIGSWVVFGVSHYMPAGEPVVPATHEFTLKDGTRCVAIGDKALVCDFSKPVVGL